MQLLSPLATHCTASDNRHGVPDPINLSSQEAPTFSPCEGKKFLQIGEVAADAGALKSSTECLHTFRHPVSKYSKPGGSNSRAPSKVQLQILQA